LRGKRRRICLLRGEVWSREIFQNTECNSVKTAYRLCLEGFAGLLVFFGGLVFSLHFLTIMFDVLLN